MEKAKAKCFNCAAPVDDDSFCYGCKAYVCDKCDKSIMLMGHHSKEQHLTEGDDE